MVIRWVYAMELAKEPRINSNSGMKLQKLHILYFEDELRLSIHTFIFSFFFFLFLFGVMGNLPIHVIWGQRWRILSPQPSHPCTPNIHPHEIILHTFLAFFCQCKFESLKIRKIISSSSHHPFGPITNLHMYTPISYQQAKIIRYAGGGLGLRVFGFQYPWRGVDKR